MQADNFYWIKLSCLLSPLLISVLLFNYSSVFAEDAGPRLHIQDPIVDFGTVNAGKMITHSFTLKNVGTKTLKITGIKADCGCSASNLLHPNLEPGQETKLTASFDSSGYYGHKRRTFRIVSNDTMKSSSTVLLEGTIIRELELNPSRIYFGMVHRGKKAIQEVKLKIASPEFKVLKVGSRSPWIEVRQESSDLLSVILKPNAPIGILRTSVSIVTNSKSQKVFDLPIFARVVGDLSLEPVSVSFGLHEGPLKKEMVKTVSLLNTGGQSLKIVVESMQPEIEARLLRRQVYRAKGGLKPQEKFVIEIKILKNSMGNIRGQVRVESNHPDKKQSVLTIPVYAMITQKGN